MPCNKRERGGTGRRTGLKIQRSKDRGGSIPPARTTGNLLTALVAFRSLQQAGLIACGPLAHQADQWRDQAAS